MLHVANGPGVFRRTNLTQHCHDFRIIGNAQARNTPGPGFKRSQGARVITRLNPGRVADQKPRFPTRAVLFATGTIPPVQTASSAAQR